MKNRNERRKAGGCALLAVFLPIFLLLPLLPARAAAEENAEAMATGYFDWVSVSETGQIFFSDVKGAKKYWVSVDGGDYVKASNGADLLITATGSHAVRLEAYSVSKELRNGDELLAVWKGTVEYDGTVFRITDYERPPEKEDEEAVIPKDGTKTEQNPSGFSVGTFFAGIAIGLVCGAAGAAVVTVLLYKKKRGNHKK